MADARPGGTVDPARPRLADTDEFPVLDGETTFPASTGAALGPTPNVHLVSWSVTAAAELLPRELVAVSPASPILDSDVIFLPDLPMPAETARPEPTEWRPVDPQNAREVLRVGREVEIPQDHHRTRRPRPPQLSSGDATERMTRLAQVDQRRRAVMVAAAIVVVAGLLGTIWHFTDPGYAAAQPSTTWNQVALPRSTVATTETSPAVSPSASPRSAPSTTPAPVPSELVTAEPTQAVPSATTSSVPAILKSNAIYGSTITGSCPDQGTPTDPRAATAALTAYVACMNHVWDPMVAAGQGIRFREASIYFYVNTTITGCATLHVSDPVTAMYCPVDATIYVSPSGVANSVGDRYYGAELVTHEYVHHIQSLAQILTAVSHESWTDNEKSRRLQLQAHCLSFALLTHVDGFAPELETFRLGWRAGPGTATYGSVSSLQHWGEKGISATRVGDCETYTVAPPVVS